MQTFKHFCAVFMYCVILKCIVLYLICWRIPHTTDFLSLFSVCLSLCLLVSLPLYPFASLSLSFPLCFVPLPLCPSAYLPLWLLASLPPCLSLSPCLSVSLFLCLLVSLHCPYVFLSICVLFLCLLYLGLLPLCLPTKSTGLRLLGFLTIPLTRRSAHE